MLVCVFVMCLAGTFDILLLTFCLTVCGTVFSWTRCRCVIVIDDHGASIPDIPKSGKTKESKMAGLAQAPK